MDSELVDTLAGESWDAGHPLLPRVVERCITLKAKVVEEDEYETTGLRAILNFGHTVGHAVEFAFGFGSVLHGEAISVGMVVEAKVGEILGLTRPGVCQAVKLHLQGQGLPTSYPILRSEDALIAAMYGDKKVIGGSLRLSLLTDIGQCKLVDDVPENVVREAMRAS
jgi:3-dehydroquinate synthase